MATVYVRLNADNEPLVFKEADTESSKDKLKIVRVKDGKEIGEFSKSDVTRWWTED
jgi:hypothetical protein